MVASTVRALPGRRLPAAPEPAPATTAKAATPTPGHPPRIVARKPSAALHAIEPNRRRRIAHGREPIGATIDLHGYDQDQARAALEAFVLASWRRGHRAVLVITGQGRMGGGVLRRRAPEWLHAPALRAVVAGFSPAERRHGGEGALYIALKAPPEP
jgi:DNA-nicking Smr family endonuclease